MHRIGVLLVTLVMALAGCSSVPFDPNEPLSDRDRAAIERMVRQQTPEKILSVEREAPKKVLVITGYLRSAHEGTGTKFLLKQTRKGWKVQQKNAWML